ncbi:winged helix-turn-helix transcriptional regulator [Actinoplanes couchii]|uniref:Transcriptional regulator n=1 Tax=Actinoplanes couchii TaxID=403638 RepID=A0ABQ3XND5_9ACTN|nr:helix-turn-helix domain-containing protein [Actinoplanes couchii]MDR6318075.1 DNA-binding HxlR family transcriptional regulator [Actinoplanes couchii]GID60008.1 transcriptional regulator [Actinoplanes couchii]
MDLDLLLPPGMTVTPAMKEQCPLRDTLDRIGDRWTVIVVVLLLPGPRRFTELMRAAEGVSQRMLTHTLRNLERDGLLTRTVHACVPPKVEYELTDSGRSLAGPLTGLLHWSVRHQEAVREARSRYDSE